MVSTRFWLSLARVQGFTRARQAFISSAASREASRNYRRYYSTVANSQNLGNLGFSSSKHARPSASVLGGTSRSFAAAPVNQDEMNKLIEEINSKFAEAREEIELAAESKETVYFNEEAELAKKAVNEVLALFSGLLSRLSESERGALQRSMGLKMEQLKAEVAQLDE